MVFVGEAPGPDENISGVPFVGRSGKLVEQTLTIVGLNSFRIAFLNSVFECQPAGAGSSVNRLGRRWTVTDRWRGR